MDRVGKSLSYFGEASSPHLHEPSELHVCDGFASPSQLLTALHGLQLIFVWSPVIAEYQPFSVLHIVQDAPLSSAGHVQ